MQLIVVGNPNTRKLPVDLFKNSTAHWASKNNATEVLQYGDEKGNEVP